MLQPYARQHIVSMSLDDTGIYILHNSDLRQLLSTLYLDCRLQLTSDCGETLEAVTVAEDDKENLIPSIYMMPLLPFKTKTQYSLIKLDEKSLIQACSGCLYLLFKRSADYPFNWSHPAKRRSFTRQPDRDAGS